MLKLTLVLKQITECFGMDFNYRCGLDDRHLHPSALLSNNFDFFLSFSSFFQITTIELLSVALCHQEWRPPSRNSSQPCFLRCLTNSVRFIPGWAALDSPGLRHQSLPAC